MSFYLAAILIGVVAGLRTMTAPTAVGWAAYLGWLHLQNTALAFMGLAVTPLVFTLLAIFELVRDQMPGTISRKHPAAFVARLISGGLCGAAVGAASGALIGGLIAGMIGAVIGTLGGYEVRARMAAVFDRDLPAALLEDLVALGGAAMIVTML
jgi:uncharacterized membrane protein